MRKHIRRACVHRSQMNPVQISSKLNSPFLEPFLHSIRPDPHPHVLTHTSRHRQMVAAQRSGTTCPARTRITNDMRKRTARWRRSAHRKDAALHSSRRRCITPAGKGLAVRAPSLLLPFMPTEEAAATRNRQHTLQKKHPNPLQCAFCACMWLCVPADTRSKEVKAGAEHVKGRTRKTVQQKCMEEIKRKRLLRLTILHCRQSSGNSLKN
ncbi:hypothetical protein ECC02_012536 [Trypanosoma cruzi]|uniref:Uncharacterized protein n=1 Tax=Trypanosoma cruzi TaxID=5693 RepID=A0A7J6XLJ3_TRYCR|nr:hypothetical protein ECC02_012536 [Trypanosoma cruzi]